MEYLVSVIIPTYNSAAFITDAIDSIIAQTYQNWELIIVNDGSTDSIDLVVAPYLKSDRIKYVSKENGGLGSARNFGIKQSKGVFILPLDADDVFESSFIEKAVLSLKSNHDIKIVYCNANFFGAKTGPWVLPDYSYNNLLLSNMIFSCSMFRKVDYEAVGGYDETILYEDWDFWLKVLKNGGEVYKIEEPLFYYRQHEKGSLMNDLSQKGIRHTESLETIFIENTKSFMKAYGNPIEIELDRQKLERMQSKPLVKWIIANRNGLLVRLISKLFTR